MSEKSVIGGGRGWWEIVRNRLLVRFLTPDNLRPDQGSFDTSSTFI